MSARFCDACGREIKEQEQVLAYGSFHWDGRMYCLEVTRQCPKGHPLGYGAKRVESRDEAQALANTTKPAY